MRLESDSSRICRSPLRASIIIDCDVRCSVSPAKLYSGGPAAEYPTKLPRPVPRSGCVSVYVATVHRLDVSQHQPYNTNHTYTSNYAVDDQMTATESENQPSHICQNTTGCTLYHAIH